MTTVQFNKPVTITQIATRLASIPLEKPLQTSTFPLLAIDSVLVDVHTDQGASGLGWVFAPGLGKAKSLKALIDDLGTLLIGQDAFDVEQRWRDMLNASTFIGRTGAAVMAMSGLDTALWDIAGKIANQPLGKLLGASRDSIETYASEGLWLNTSIDELCAQAVSFKERGFSAMKMRVGSTELETDIERVTELRKAIGPDTSLMVDANQGWDASRAIAFARGVEACNLLWMEEPVGYQSYDDMAQIAATIDVPLCVGETNYMVEDFTRLIDMNCGHYLMPDLMRVGGVTGMRKVAALAQAHNLPITPHLFMEVATHVACAAPNAVWQEHMPWWQVIFKQKIDFRDGHIHLSNNPGLGVEWDEKMVQKFLVN